MIWPPQPRRVVQRIPAPSTTTNGPGDILIDEYGNRYRVLWPGEASIIRSGTAVGSIYTLYPNGTIS